MDFGTAAAAISSIITFSIGWIGGRKKNDAILEAQRLTNIRSTIDIYEKTHNDLRTQLVDVSNKCIALATELQLMGDKLEIMRKENLDLKDEIFDLRAVLKGIEKLKNKEGKQ